MQSLFIDLALNFFEILPLFKSNQASKSKSAYRDLLRVKFFPYFIKFSLMHDQGDIKDENGTVADRKKHDFIDMWYRSVIFVRHWAI